MSHRFQNHRALIGAIAVGLTLSFAVTACSHAGGGKIDACKLVSATAAGRILGTRVTVRAINTMDTDPNDNSLCNYDTDSPHGGFILIAGRVHYTNAAAFIAYDKKANTRDIPPGMDQPTFADVKGLGEAAYLLKAHGSFQLYVLAHGTAINIGMTQDASPRAIAQSKKLARIALGNLK